jgi:hypothetical protein
LAKDPPVAAALMKVAASKESVMKKNNTKPMISVQTFRQLALSFPGTSEQPHFDKTAFRTKKRIFATLSEKDKLACVKFSRVDQSVFCAFDLSVIYPVPNKWGLQGWTYIDLSKVKRSMLADALTIAYTDAVPG